MNDWEKGIPFLLALVVILACLTGMWLVISRALRRARTARTLVLPREGVVTEMAKGPGLMQTALGIQPNPDCQKCAAERRGRIQAEASRVMGSPAGTTPDYLSARRWPPCPHSQERTS